jgi:hypothetical protein
MLASLTARDYLRWTRTYRSEPFGPMGESLRNWVLAVATTEKPDLKPELFNPGEETAGERRKREILEGAQADFRAAQTQLQGG